MIDNQGISILKQVVEPTLPEKGSQLLLGLAAAYPRPGDTFQDSAIRVDSELLKQRDSDRSDVYTQSHFSEFELGPLKWLALSASADRKELDWLINNYLVGQGYISKSEPRKFSISLKGWQFVESLQAPNPGSRDVFIAMPFSERFTPLYERALHPGIYNAGYNPVRIDRKEHNNRIDDEIIANIRKSRFVVADLSMQRGGIYFEAGYALGLGLPVVWTVEKRALDEHEVHFDNRQYNFLVWEDASYDDLARRLTNRIEATIGRA
ncbi:MAG: hypothetical protein R3F13_02890 [Prosthecobacter sp.]